MKQNRRTAALGWLRMGLCAMLCLVLLLGNLTPALALEEEPGLSNQENPVVPGDGEGGGSVTGDGVTPGGNGGSSVVGDGDGSGKGAGGSSDGDEDLLPPEDKGVEPAGNELLAQEPPQEGTSYTLHLTHALFYGAEGESIIVSEDIPLAEGDLPLNLAGKAHTYDHASVSQVSKETLVKEDFVNGEASATISYQVEEGYQAMQSGEIVAISEEDSEETKFIITYAVAEDSPEGAQAALDAVTVKPVTYTEEDSFTLNNPADFSSGGKWYHFQGWTREGGTTPAPTMTVPKGTSGNLNFVAHWEPYVELTVSNTVTGASAETDRDFHFQVVLTNNPLTGTYGDLTFKDGAATFTLCGTASKKTLLPVGTEYTVSQQDAKMNGYTTTQTGESGPIAAAATAAFTNERTGEWGSLTISNTVTGEGADAQEFQFQVKLGDDAFTGTYGGVGFNAGEASLKLKGGESKKIPLPAGVTYTVTQTGVTGYITTKTGDNGKIAKNTESKAVFTNTKCGSLTVSNKTEGTSADPEKYFSFQVALSDKTFAGDYGVTFKGGVATLKLKHGESKEITLPVGMGYTVTQTDSNTDGYKTTGTGVQGIIGNATLFRADFTNERNGDRGNLKISLTVTGYKADKTKEFNFKVTVKDLPDGVYGGVKFEDGEAVFPLKDGESVTITGLPAGTKYTVTQEKLSGYRVTKYLDEGTIEKDRTRRCAFTNRRANLDYSFKTGDDSNVGLWLGLAGVFLVIGIGAMTFSRRRKNR